MQRKTSLEAYNMIKDNGWLSAKRWQAYDALFHSKGNLTHNELQAEIEKKVSPNNRLIYRNNIVARLGELRQMGVVDEKGERKCRISGMNCIIWDVNDKLPTKTIRRDRPKMYWGVIGADLFGQHVMFDELSAATDYSCKHGGQVIKLRGVRGE